MNKRQQYIFSVLSSRPQHTMVNLSDISLKSCNCSTKFLGCIHCQNQVTHSNQPKKIKYIHRGRFYRIILICGSPYPSPLSLILVQPYWYNTLLSYEPNSGLAPPNSLFISMAQLYWNRPPQQHTYKSATAALWYMW